MTIKRRRIKAEDGLTSTEEVTLSSGTTTRDDMLAVRALGFSDMGLEGIEKFWQPHAPPASARLPHQSFRWYAREILSRISIVRALLSGDAPASTPTLEAAVYAALHVGYLHGSAFWRFNAGDHMNLGVKTQTKNREAARKPRPRDRDQPVSDAQIVAEARRLRQKHPHYSTRALAALIARALPLSFGTVRRRLTKLGLR